MKDVRHVRDIFDHLTCAEIVNGDLAKGLIKAEVIPNSQDVRYRIEKIKKGSFLEQFGFVKDDIFLQINGIAMKGPYQLMDALRSLKKGKEHTFIVLRSDKEVMIKYFCSN